MHRISDRIGIFFENSFGCSARTGPALASPASRRSVVICRSCLRVIRGPWRSPVAHLHGMQGVRGSNPLGSTKVKSSASCGALCFGKSMVAENSRGPPLRSPKYCPAIFRRRSRGVESPCVRSDPKDRAAPKHRRVAQACDPARPAKRAGRAPYYLVVRTSECSTGAPRGIATSPATSNPSRA